MLSEVLYCEHRKILPVKGSVVHAINLLMHEQDLREQMPAHRVRQVEALYSKGHGVRHRRDGCGLQMGRGK